VATVTKNLIDAARADTHAFLDRALTLIYKGSGRGQVTIEIAGSQITPKVMFGERYQYDADGKRLTGQPPEPSC
jgi:hypothetical protein